MMALRLRATPSLVRPRIPGAPRPHPTHGWIGGRSSSSSSNSSSNSFGSRLWERYTRALLKRPILIKGGAASVIFFASDSATQRLLDPTKDWDGTRALSGAGFGVVATVWLHYWWNFLEVVVNKRLPVGAYGQNKLVNALGKVVADQLVGAPLYLYSYYCITHLGTELQKKTQRKQLEVEDGQSPPAQAVITGSELGALLKETSDRAASMLPDTLLRHWTLWPVCHTLNFYYLPIHHRVLFQNTVLIFWSGYLSHLNNGGLANEAAAKASASKESAGEEEDEQKHPLPTALATSGRSH